MIVKVEHPNYETAFAPYTQKKGKSQTAVRSCADHLSEEHYMGEIYSFLYRFRPRLCSFGRNLMQNG